MRFHFSPISEKTVVSEFSCEEESLNHFLKVNALNDQKRKLSATRVATIEEDESKQVVGYYTICPTEV